MDQVGQQGDASAGDEDGKLSDGRRAQHGERESDRYQALSGAFDARVNQAVGVAVAAVVVVVVRMRAVVVVRVDFLAVSVTVATERLVGQRVVHPTKIRTAARAAQTTVRWRITPTTPATAMT